MRVEDIRNKILVGDVLERLRDIPDESINLIITSPPYWGLRDYGHPGQIGLEDTLEEYLERLLEITDELKRVLRKDGLLFWNHGDAYGGKKSAGPLASEKSTLLGGRGRNPKASSDVFPSIDTGFRPKTLIMQNYRLAERMENLQGWYLRNIIIWHKPNAMPESIRDRFKTSYEPVFMFSKSRKYYFDLNSVRVPHKNAEEWAYRRKLRENKQYVGKGYPQNTIGARSSKRKKTSDESYKGDRNSRKNPPEPGEPGAFHPSGKNPGDVWSISTKGFPDAHFAVFPETLVEPMIKAGCPPDGIVLDPFLGSGTTALVALKLGRSFVGIELNPEYVEIARKRIAPYMGIKRLDEFEEVD